MTRLLQATAILLLSLSVGSVASARASITGVCPDGSMFIVKRKADIPCSQSKQVEPSDLPPIKPEYLPKPYGWTVFQNKHDPNNPYNLIERAQTIREAGEPLDDADNQTAPAPTPERQTQQQAALAPVAAAPPPAPRALELSPVERRDLALIVELSQQRSSARFAGPDAPVVVELAHSRAFQERLHAHYADGSLGPVVLFNAAANAPADFHANFTFVQGHNAFHPRGTDPKRMGLLAGELGSLDAGESVLGYAVLPPETDLSEPIDIYWNDRRISVALSP